MAKYKVGDKVRVRSDLVEGEEYGDMIFLRDMCKFRGKIVAIKSTHHKWYGIEGYPSEFWSDEMFDGLAEEESPREFKVGDRIRVNKKGLNDWPKLKKEGVDLGTVIVYKHRNDIGIQFDKKFGGHDCGGDGEHGYCWWVAEDEIELIKEEPKQEPTPTPVVNVNVTVNLYENACWYCRKGGLVDLYLAGAMGICPSCGRVCNNITPKNKIVIEVEPPKRENKPLTTEELRKLPNGARVFTVWLDKPTGKPRPDDDRTCWRTVNHGERQLDRKNGQVSIGNNGRLYHAYLEIPEGYKDNEQ